ncbi:MAG TPA: glycosyltransferase family 2 protein [Devosiaceae bacterium]|jgi:dolichol-phosphate mannosyltransferase
MAITYSLVIPVFNEERVLPLLLRRLNELMTKLDGPAEVIFVDDGSSDATGVFLGALARGDHRYRYIGFSRNFGQQIAITAGMEAASGQAVILMDADLQDPPEVVLQLAAKWREGYEIVYAQRTARNGEHLAKRVTSSLFYRLFNWLVAEKIPRDVGDFRLIDRIAVDAFLEMPEANRFVRGMLTWIGFRQIAVPYERDARAAGNTKYSAAKLIRLAATAVVSFSDVPLRAAIWGGAIISLGAMAYGLFVIYRAFFWTQGLIDGWASTVVIISMLSGVNLTMTGIVGVYIGRIYSEVKRRPLYVVARRIGFEHEATAALKKSAAS